MAADHLLLMSPAGKPLRIAILSHHPGLALSYARVAREVGYGLERQGFTITWIGLPQAGASPASHRRAVLLPKADTQQALARWLGAHRPDMLLTIGDPWMFMGIPRLARHLRLRWAAYFPLDGRPLPEEWEPWVSDCDIPIVYSRFARDVIADAIGIVPAIAPHGVDLAVFRPVDRTLARQAIGVDGFVVGTVAANHQRKNLPTLLDAFSRFARDKTDVQLYLHTPINGPCWDLPRLAEHFQIAPLLHTTPDYQPTRGVSDEVLCRIYNAMDVFVLPTMAEGFGLPIIEAQACGIPTLATDYSACPELLADPFQRLPVQSFLYMQRNLEQAIVDVRTIQDRLEQLYADPALRQRLAEVGRETVLGFTWDACCHAIAEAVAPS